MKFRVFLIVLLVVAGCSGGGGAPGSGGTADRLKFPFIISADKAAPTPVNVGETVRLQGNYFGKDPGTVVIRSATDDKLTLRVSGADIVSWSDSAIEFRLPLKDNAGEVLLSTHPLIGNAKLGITRADSTTNALNTDLEGKERPVTLLLECKGRASVTLDTQRHGFTGMSLLYRLVSPAGEYSRGMPFSSVATTGDLSTIFNVPARTDYKVTGVLYSGPLDADGKPTGGVLFESSPAPLQVLASQPASLTMTFPCDNYAVCSVLPPSFSGIVPSTGPGSGPGQPGSNTGQTPVVTATPTPEPSPSLPSGVTADVIANYGTLSTLAGLGTSRATPVGTVFGKDSNIGMPWGVQYDSQGTLYFTLISGIVARQTGTATFEKVIDAQDKVAGKPLSIIMVFDFVPPNDDLVLTEQVNLQVSADVGRVVYVPKVNGSYSINGAYNLDFGSIKVEMPSAVQYYRGKLYVASGDNIRNGTGASHIVEYDPGTRASRVVAGNGTPGYMGDGGPATQARISPIDIGFGPAGTALEGLMVIADGGTNALRAVNLNASGSIDFHGTVIPAGNIDSIAGRNSKRWPDLTTFPGESGFDSYSFILDMDGNGGFSGDGGPATEAKLNWPFDPRFDAKGRLYFADADNHRLRVIDRNGIIHTIAGSVDLSTNHDHRGFDSPGGFNRDKFSQRLIIPNGDGGDPRSGDINHPMDMHLKENADGTITFWIGETDSLRIRKITGFQWAT